MTMSNEMTMNNEMTAIKKIQEGFSMLVESLPTCNPMAPGFLKEVFLANLLGHKVALTKHLCDAYDEDGKEQEYLTCMEDGVNKEGKKLNRAFAIDGVFSSPVEDKEGSLERIRRNDKIYYGIFKEGMLECIELWVGCPKDLEKFVDENVTRRGMNGKNREHTVNISKKWVRENCEEITI